MVFADEVCQAIVLAITKPWPDPGPATAVWGFAVDHDEAKTLGRRVNVFPDPAGFLQSGPGTRRGDQFDHGVLIVVWEKCPPADRVPSAGEADEAAVPGQPSREWMTERLRWAIALVRRISNHRDVGRLVVKDADTGEETMLVPQESEVTAQYDPDAAARGVFMAQFRVVYRELE